MGYLYLFKPAKPRPPETTPMHSAVCYSCVLAVSQLKPPSVAIAACHHHHEQQQQQQQHLADDWVNYLSAHACAMARRTPPPSLVYT